MMGDAVVSNQTSNRSKLGVPIKICSHAQRKCEYGGAELTFQTSLDVDIYIQRLTCMLHPASSTAKTVVVMIGQLIGNIDLRTDYCHGKFETLAEIRLEVLTNLTNLLVSENGRL